jgi:hypothetical protein
MASAKISWSAIALSGTLACIIIGKMKGVRFQLLCAPLEFELVAGHQIVA